MLGECFLKISEFGPFPLFRRNLGQLCIDQSCTGLNHLLKPVRNDIVEDVRRNISQHDHIIFILQCFPDISNDIFLKGAVYRPKKRGTPVFPVIIAENRRRIHVKAVDQLYNVPLDFAWEDRKNLWGISGKGPGPGYMGGNKVDIQFIMEFWHLHGGNTAPETAVHPFDELFCIPGRRLIVSPCLPCVIGKYGNRILVFHLYPAGRKEPRIPLIRRYPYKQLVFAPFQKKLQIITGKVVPPVVGSDKGAVYSEGAGTFCCDLNRCAFYGGIKPELLAEEMCAMFIDRNILCMPNPVGLFQ